MNHVRNRADLPVLESFKVDPNGDEVAVLFAISSEYEYLAHSASEVAVVHDEEGAINHNAFHADTQIVRVVYRRRKR